MVTKDGITAKIIDFGSCKDMEGTEFEKMLEEQHLKNNPRKSTYKNFVGTPHYMAPECVHNKNSDFKSDMWSLGCLLFQLITGFPPFRGGSEYLIFKKSIEGEYTFPEIVPDDAKDLIEKLIVVDPEKRLTMEEVNNHKYLCNENKDESFRREIPKVEEEVFIKVMRNIKGKYEKYREISEKLKRIDNYERLEEESKQHGITQDDSNSNPVIEEDKKLVLQKVELKEEYDFGLKEFDSEVEEYISGSKSEDSCIGRFKFFKVQVYHDMFGKIYE